MTHFGCHHRWLCFCGLRKRKFATCLDCWHLLPFRHTHMLMVVGGGDTPQTLCYPAPISLSCIAHVGVTAQGTAHSRLRCDMRARAYVHAFIDRAVCHVRTDECQNH
jgi:hypothetical protein